VIDCSKPRTKAIVLGGGRRLLPKQDALLRTAATIVAIFGGWRSGKTRGCALKLLTNAFANPHREEYGEDRPYSLVIGPTLDVLRDSGYREIKSLLPKELIAKESKKPWELHLVNGHIIKFRSAKGQVEGASACAVWLDEAHLLEDDALYLNYQARASDALGKRFLVLVSGLAESGWLQDTLDRPEHAKDAGRFIAFCATSENYYNPPHVIPQFRASVSKATAIKYLEGRWMPKDGVIYFEYDPRLHLVDKPGDRKMFVHLGVDAGNKGAIVFFQEVQRRVRDQHGKESTALGLHVVDEMLPENQSLASAMREAKARGWIIDEKRSVIFVDPTLRSDEFDAIRSVFGTEINIVRKKRGDKAEKVEYGHDAVNAAFKDVDGNVRLTIYSGLPRMERSLITVITRYHRGPNGKPVRDDQVDHVLDAFRYPVAHLLPLAA
jgi:hypothetical protein